MDTHQPDTAASLDDMLSKMQAIMDNPMLLAAYPQLESSDAKNLVKLVLQEDGTVAVSLNPALFGMGGNVIAAQLAVGEAVANLLGVGAQNPGGPETRSQELQEIGEYFTSARKALVDKMKNVNDYVAAVKSRIEAARATL